MHALLMEAASHIKQYHAKKRGLHTCNTCILSLWSKLCWMQQVKQFFWPLNPEQLHFWGITFLKPLSWPRKLCAPVAFAHWDDLACCLHITIWNTCFYSFSHNITGRGYNLSISNNAACSNLKNSRSRGDLAIRKGYKATFFFSQRQGKLFDMALFNNSKWLKKEKVTVYYIKPKCRSIKTSRHCNAQTLNII